MSETNKSLLANIIQARENIKTKYNALKREKFETETLMNNTLSSIIEPLNKIQQQQHLNPSSEPEFSPSLNTTYTSTKPENEDNNIFNVYNAFKTSAGVDKIYGPRKLRNGVIVLGRKKIKFIENELHIEDNGNGSYPLTSGLTSLLFSKSPNMYTKNDLNTYREILNKTLAHKTKYGGEIKMNGGKKYELISKLFSTVGRGVSDGEVKGINMRLQKTHGPVYWNDANELVDRLRLLYSSVVAGNTVVRNEIITICEELVEAKLLQKIPNV